MKNNGIKGTAFGFNGFVFDTNESSGMKILCVQEIIGGLGSTSAPTTFGLGLVSKCTLIDDIKPVEKINLDGRSYCVVYKGHTTHPEAFETCKKLNARLPLPRNKKESEAFLKAGGYTGTLSSAHVDARNPKKTEDKTEWVDAEGKPLGTRPVYQRVINY